MWTFAGKTAISVAISHQPASPPQARDHQSHAAGDLGHAARIDQLPMGRQVGRHDRHVPPRAREVHRPGEDEEGTGEESNERAHARTLSAASAAAALRAGASATGQHRQQRAELDLRLGQLCLGVGVADHAHACVAVGRAVRSNAERRATQNSPSSAESTQPTGPAYHPRSRPLELRDRRRGARPRLAPTPTSDAAPRELDRAV